MSARRTYLDYNATAPLRPEARAAVLAALDAGGNPSSVHAEGRRARALVETAREQVAELVGAVAADVVFTSGATEAANTVLRRAWRTILFARIEHPCVVAPVLAAEGRIVELAVDGDGVIDVAAFAARLAELAAAGQLPAGQSLVCVQMANNETGVLQPVSRIAGIARSHGVAVLCDAVQAAGRIGIDFRTLGVDYLIVSSHKIGGPKGVGALVAHDGGGLAPLIIGGGQERRHRAGTENVEGIAGFGAAAVAARRDLADISRITRLRDGVERELRAARDDVVIVAGLAPRLANTTCVGVPGVAAETLVIKLDLAGIAVSAGSACASGKVGSSPVLAAMGIAPEVARTVIRVSLGRESTEADAARFVEAWRRAVSQPAGKELARARAAGAAIGSDEAAPGAASMGER